MDRPKVLFVSSEVFPFAKTGGLADVSGSLPRALFDLGCDIRVITPFYKATARGSFDIRPEKKRIKHDAVRMSSFDLYSNEKDGLTTYFISLKRYFLRNELYGTAKQSYPDNALRFGSFSKAVPAAMKAVDFRPDLIHCNDWQTALIPFYMKFRFADDGFFSGIKALFTIHNLEYQGIFDKKFMRGLGIPEAFFSPEHLEFHGDLNLMKAGILYSDAISTVSRRYAQEILTPEHGAGLDNLLKDRKDVLYGIHNGVDYSHWSPENDRHIKVNYGIDSADKKLECKKDLLACTGLAVPAEKPLFGCVSRLAEQKGMDLVADIMDRLVDLGAGVVVLGRGSREYNMMFMSLQKKYPRNVSYCMEFNDELAHKIEAGCDMFLMPSRYEPCGLNQMYSLKYGTIPVVRATGGLDDVIVDFDADRENGNGFKFGPPDPEEFYKAISRAVGHYADKDLWRKLVVRAMSYDFSWARSAEEYLDLYDGILKKGTT